jgi:ABC-type multidrug transport system ATPase subunit
MCAAILHNPKVLILDEPFSGLDVYSVKMFISFLKTYMQQDKCILFTSHSFEHLKDFVTHIAIIEHQTIIYNDTIMAFTNNGQTQMDAALLHQLQYKTDENHKKLNFLK